MTIAPSNITTQFAADFGAVDPALIQTYITQAYLFMNPNVWGSKLDTGALYLTAHWMAVDGVPGLNGNTTGTGAANMPTGALTSQRVAQVGASYAAPLQSADDLNLTRYGLVYKRLKRGLNTTPMVAGGDFCGYPFNSDGFPRG